MTRLHYGLIAVALLAMGCEDGPDRIFEPVDDDPPLASGDTWTQPGSRGFGDTSSGDARGRARFCDEAETSALIPELVTQPIIPDQSVGGIPLWTEDGDPLVVDTLVGRPEDGKFCDPTGVYSDAFTWGPTNEIIVFFNEETRIVESILAYTSYLGTLEGSYTNEAGEQVPVLVQPRERVRIDDTELDQYTSRADEASRTNAWLNYDNITSVYKMIRESFFDAEPFADDFDCVAAQLCKIIYTASDESVPQDTAVLMQDSGIAFAFTPEGQVTYVEASPVRVAPFEVAGTMTFGSTGDTTTVAPVFDSVARDGCAVDISNEMTWTGFRDSCIDSPQTLQRVDYNVHTARDAVSVGFNGITLDFLRDTRTSGMLRDGEAPGDEDVLYGMTFTESLPAPIAQFVPADLGARYKALLEAKIQSAVKGSGGAPHPFESFELTVPASLPAAPQRLGELLYLTEQGPKSWLPDVIADIQAQYAALTPEQKAAIDPMVTDPLFILEPFVHAVIDAFSLDATQGPEARYAFRTTDNERWAIGFGHFVWDGAPYRLVVQYSLNFGYVTAVTVERGFSTIDTVLNSVNGYVRDTYGLPTSPYYELAFSAAPTPYGLGGDGIVVNGYDRELETLDVDLTMLEGDGPSVMSLSVPGDPIAARSGFLRQIRGERFEFVPAHAVRLYGKESSFLYHVDEAGEIARVEQFNFKGFVELCGGLGVAYGDDVRATVEAWSSAVGSSAYGNCEVVFNYSEDGHVLTSIASLSNKVAVGVAAGRAISAAMWK